MNGAYEERERTVAGPRRCIRRHWRRQAFWKRQETGVEVFIHYTPYWNWNFPGVCSLLETTRNWGGGIRTVYALLELELSRRM
jgi:uncharacterized protein YjiS (DUF1127 family)